MGPEKVRCGMWRGKAVVAIYSHSDQIPQGRYGYYEASGSSSMHHLLCRVKQNCRREKKRKTPKRYSTEGGVIRGGFSGEGQVVSEKRHLYVQYYPFFDNKVQSSPRS